MAAQCSVTLVVSSAEVRNIARSCHYDLGDALKTMSSIVRQRSRLILIYDCSKGSLGPTRRAVLGHHGVSRRALGSEFICSVAAALMD